MPAIDLNADVGEGFGHWTLGDDAGLLSVVSSANVACGFHAGDPSIMRDVCQRAADNGVAIGAHIGYCDLVGFGRRAIAVTARDLHADALYQIGALDAFARRAGSRVSYVKPHGALYHAAAGDADLAAAIVEALRDHNPSLVLLGPGGSQLESAAAGGGIAFAREGFADRTYGDTGALLPRSSPGAVHSDVDVMVGQAKALALDHSVTTVGGKTIALRVASICVHGDSPGALQAARLIKSALVDNGVTIAAFASAGDDRASLPAPPPPADPIRG